MRSMMRVCAAAAVVLSGSAVVSAQAGRLICLDSNRNVYELNPATAERTLVGAVSAAVGTAGGLAYDCNAGVLYLTSTSLDRLYTVDMTTWQATEVGFYGDSTIVMHGLEWDSSTGTLYGGSNGNLYTIDTSTGLATLIGASGLGSSFVNLGYDPTTDTLYGSYATTDSTYVMDRSTGFATLVGPMNGPTNPHGFAYDHDAGIMYVVCSSTDNLYTLNLETGAATSVGALGSGNYLGLAYISNTPGCYEPDGGCPADFNGENGVTVQDIYDFLTAWNANDPSADFNGENGVTVQDIYDFLTAWNAGCP